MKFIKQCRVCGKHYEYDVKTTPIKYERCCSDECRIKYYVKYRCGSVPQSCQHLKKKIHDFAACITLAEDFAKDKPFKLKQYQQKRYEEVIKNVV